MEKFHKEKITAIVPALNEEKNVGNVLKVLLDSKYFDEIILVDDGSTDKTAEVGKSFKVTVLKLSKNTGKGNAMREGIKIAKTNLIAFFDADLIGLSEKHIALLIEPMLQENISMCVGIREHAIDATGLGPLMALGGERVIRKDLLEKIPEEMTQGFAIETSLNYYCLKNNLSVKYVNLMGLSIITKEKKWGFGKGFLMRIKMIFEIIKIRLKIYAQKNNFK